MGKKDKDRYINRELSWLAFNERVLQEARDPRVPLFERLGFLAIFSSNLDEFFRVRVASLRSLLRLKKKAVDKLGFEPDRLLRQIHDVVTEQQETFGEILRDEVLPALEAYGIYLIDERGVTDRQGEVLRAYFDDEIREHLSPALLDGEETPFLENNGLYLVVELWPKASEGEGVHLSAQAPHYALVEIPSSPLARFMWLPGDDEHKYVIFLDDVIRYNLPRLFRDHEVGAAYALKLSRDAELYIEDEFDGDLVAKIEKSLVKRDKGLPSRFLYDLRAPYTLVSFLESYFGLTEEDLVPGGRYHNLSDLFRFPRFGMERLQYPELPPLPHPELEGAGSMMATMAEKDRLLSTPYQSFRYVIQFLEEAARDPDVEALWVTLYRVAEDSGVVQAMMRAAEAGKQVTAFVEVKARFDEAHNLHWAEQMEAAGVRTLYSMPGIKVHAKLALAARREAGALRHYAYLGTGNFNEQTARLYCDHGLFTADPRLADEVRRVFSFLEGEVEEPQFEHLLVAPFHLREAFYGLIDAEIERARAGEEARLVAKMNSLEDAKIIKRLYKAGRAGVDVQLIVRGICGLAPGIDGRSDNIQARSIVDRFLEHARIYRFHHGGEDRLYLASADWMHRNLSHRVEVAFPIYDPDVRRDLLHLLDLQQADDTKARTLDAEQRNHYAHADTKDTVRAQIDAYRYFFEKWEAAHASLDAERNT